MKKILVIGLILISYISFGQTYSPSNETGLNKPVGVTGMPTDGRSYFHDLTNFKYRQFVSVAEALSFLNTSQKRQGHMEIVVNTGGTLLNGVITGGTNDIYYFKDGVADNNLVLKIPNISNLLLTQRFLDTVAAINARIPAPTNLSSYATNQRLADTSSALRLLIPPSGIYTTTQRFLDSLASIRGAIPDLSSYTTIQRLSDSLTAVRNLPTGKGVAKAYVETNGNDATGRLSDPSRPFLTINSACDALPSTGGIIVIGFGEFNSPLKSKIKSNTYFLGSGMPAPNWLVSIPSYGAETKTKPTKLVGGTILHGTFDKSQRNNITVAYLGVDVGQDWCNTFNSGLAVDGILSAQVYSPGGGESALDGVHRVQSQGTPSFGTVLDHVSALVKDSNSLIHAVIMENEMNLVVSNVYSYLGFHGIVFKGIGGVATNLFAYGNAADGEGVIVKSDDYANTYNFVLNGVTIGDIQGTGSGITIENSASSPSIFGINLSNFNVIHTSYGVRTKGLVDNATIANGQISLVTGDGFYSPDGLSNSSVRNITIRGSGGKGFILKSGTLGSPYNSISGIKSVGNSGGNFDISSNVRLDVSDIMSYLGSGVGIAFGNNVCGTGITNINTTITGTYTKRDSFQIPTPPTINMGDFEFYKQYTGNSILSINEYYDPEVAALKYRTNGIGSYLQFFNGGLIFATSPSGNANSVVTGYAPLTIDANGKSVITSTHIAPLTLKSTGTASYMVLNSVTSTPNSGMVFQLNNRDMWSFVNINNLHALYNAFTTEYTYEVDTLTNRLKFHNIALYNTAKTLTSLSLVYKQHMDSAIATAISNIPPPNLSSYATTQRVLDSVAAIRASMGTGNGSVDLSSYSTIQRLRDTAAAIRSSFSGFSGGGSSGSFSAFVGSFLKGDPSDSLNPLDVDLTLLDSRYSSNIIGSNGIIVDSISGSIIVKRGDFRVDSNVAITSGTAVSIVNFPIPNGASGTLQFNMTVSSNSTNDHAFFQRTIRFRKTGAGVLILYTPSISIPDDIDSGLGSITTIFPQIVSGTGAHPQILINNSSGQSIKTTSTVTLLDVNYAQPAP